MPALQNGIFLKPEQSLSRVQARQVGILALVVSHIGVVLVAVVPSDVGVQSLLFKQP